MPWLLRGVADHRSADRCPMHPPALDPLDGQQNRVRAEPCEISQLSETRTAAPSLGKRVLTCAASAVHEREGGRNSGRERGVRWARSPGTLAFLEPAGTRTHAISCQRRPIRTALADESLVSEGCEGSRTHGGGDGHERSRRNVEARPSSARKPPAPPPPDCPPRGGHTGRQGRRVLPPRPAGHRHVEESLCPSVMAPARRFSRAGGSRTHVPRCSCCTAAASTGPRRPRRGICRAFDCGSSRPLSGGPPREATY